MIFSLGANRKIPQAVQPFLVKSVIIVVKTGEVMEKEAERLLVMQARKNPEAFGRLFEEYHPHLLKYAAFRTGNVEIARDIVSETFFKAFKNLWKFRFIGTTFSAWLYRVAGNTITDHFRTRTSELKYHAAAFEDRKSLDPCMGNGFEHELREAQEELDRNREYAAIKNALLGLPSCYQEVLVLRFFQGYKIADIGEIIGKKQGTTKSLVSRGVSMLRESLGASVQRDKEEETEAEQYERH
jgi:RNA polymerase sigma factor (sigma-70 family)